MGRKADLNTPAQYQIFQTYIGYKNGAAVCRHCGKTDTNNTNRLKLHLIECQLYQQFLIAQTAERVVKKRRLESGKDDLIQATIGDHLTLIRHARADELAALIVFQAGLPFTFFEKPEVIAFLRALNSAYIPPKATFLKTTMLDNT
jgi:BED zinc finger